MRILLLTPQLPYPPRQGTALRNWGILSNLARHHEVWLLTFDEHATTDQPPADAVDPVLRAACKQLCVFPLPQRTTRDRLRTLFTSSLPDMAWRLWSPAFAATFDEWTTKNDFDIIQVEGIELARYILQSKIQNLKSKIAKIVFDDHNCEYLLQRRSCETDLRQPRRWHAAAYSFIQWQRLRAFERRAALAADAVLSVSPQDAAALAQLDPAVKPHIIFNGIDVASYATYVAGADHPLSSPNLAQYTGAPQYAGAQSSISHPPISHLQSPTLVFTGKMDFRPNIDAMLWFGREVFPLIKPAIPGVQLLIVGQQPSPRLDVLRADTHITLTGWVDDQRPYIAQAGVYIAPLRVGGGTRFKLLEAMAMRRAIVSTTLGCEGFDVTSGREMAIADTPAAFADAVIQLLRDEARRAGMGCRAHDFVAATYDWSVIVPKLERVYNDMQR